MAYFKGTLEDFMKFLGGYARNKVQYISSNHKKKVGKCEHCHSRTKKLDAAHVRGKERPKIIGSILENFIHDDIIEIDLNEFEDLFLQAHNPIKETIKILCKECHWKYDNPGSVLIDDSLEEDTEMLQESEFDEIKEVQAVLKSLTDSRMNKNEAIEFLKRNLNLELTSNNTIYSNKNAALNVWWLEPSNQKFLTGFYIVLNHSENKKLLVFKIPENIIKPEQTFEQRHEKGVSKIIISTLYNEYTDKKSFNFKPYLINEISY